MKIHCPCFLTSANNSTFTQSDKYSEFQLSNKQGLDTGWCKGGEVSVQAICKDKKRVFEAALRALTQISVHYESTNQFQKNEQNILTQLRLNS